MADTPALKTPDFTPAQIVAAVFGAILPVLTLVGVELSPAQVAALDDLYKVALGLFAADAGIRIGRAVGNTLRN
jgi:hypothetical protein